MKYPRVIIFFLISFLASLAVKAGQWTTHFAYNNVTQIAMGSDKVFAISDGSLFSVDKQTEKITKYDRQSGLHGIGIKCIHYDSIGNQLIITYGDGKIDILSSHGVTYISELYNKEMTQRKDIYNVTIKGRTAYLATHYGIQTMDLRENKLVDSYWLRPGGQETPIQDVRIIGDSIYAFGGNYNKSNQTVLLDSIFSAALTDNLVDYTFWRREKNTGRIAQDTDKGKHYQDNNSNWYAGGADGIRRVTATETLTYKPDGPLVNIPYALSAVEDKIIMVSGERWTSQKNRAGHVMLYDNTCWTNIPADSIKAKTGSLVLDMMNSAIDPNNHQHFFTTSYGTGLYEFQGDSCVSHTLTNDVIGAAAPSNPSRYTRLIGAHYDTHNRLWFLAAGAVPYHLIVKDSSNYYGLLPSTALPSFIEIPADVIIDKRNENYKWVGVAYKQTGCVLVDDKGTPFDSSDDQVLHRGEWINQNKLPFTPTCLYAMMQDHYGRIWMATDLGAAYIDSATNFFNSNAIIQPDIVDDSGNNPITSQAIKAICETPNGDIWLGSEGLGIYVLNSSCSELRTHYTTDNSALSSNAILSLACDGDAKVWIGTAEGLVECHIDNSGEGFPTDIEDKDSSLDPGDMMQWRLHFSYANPQEIAATPDRIFAIANGALFSVDRADEAISYWNKSTGLNGSTVSKIAYDATSDVLIIGYEDGRIDLLSKDGSVTQMPDIYMKAGSLSTAINQFCIGSKYIYAAMSFGIVAINPRKAEIVDTYYIGANAAAIDIQQLVQMRDSLYAFSFDCMYSASLKDNLVDFSYWKSTALPFSQAQQAVVYKEHIYVLESNSLYCRDGNTWSLVVPNQLEWVHVSNNQLLTYERNNGLLRLTDEGTLVGLSSNYVAQDAIYSLGEYWLAEEGRGLVRLGSNGDNFFQTEGPMNNFSYKLQVANNQIYVAPGGRWATQFARQSGLSIYNGQQWRSIPWQDTWYYTDHDIRDVACYAVDANDPSHFFVATYGTGVFEFKDYKAVNHYDSLNSTLRRAAPTVSDYYYTRTDGAMLDENGNFWVLNATSIGRPLHVRTPAGQWFGIPLISGIDSIKLTTPTGIWTDKRNSHHKWMMDQRENPRIILLDDSGTPTISTDDKCIARSKFVDQNGKTLTPDYFYSFAQDHSNRIWIGTNKGIILIPSTTNFFTSNACRRIIIPRNDGTGLGDYLLGEEQINCMAVDGGNRMWIGTANSGLYLIEDDTITAAHFTETNSLLPSNNILSIAIIPNTGEVFVGTDKGIASYRSDASEPQTDMSNAYAYPNPVRPNYGGMISITGLMDNTVVNIVDAGGNLVCKTKSHGGTAVWDGKLPDGRRATPGIYTALCNASEGHVAVKIMVIR